MLWLVLMLATQSAPCPVELETAFDEDSYAENLSIDTGDPEDGIACCIRFKGTGELWEVSMQFFARKGEALQQVSTTREATSFRPTAVCRGAGFGDTLYVAGWDSASGSAVVEQWVVTVAALRTGSPAGGPGERATVMADPVVRKSSVLAAGSGVGPIQSIACNPYAKELLLSQYGSPAVLYTVDLQTKQLSGSIDASQLPALEGRPHLNAGQASGAGFFIACRAHPKWVPSLDPAEELILVLQDTDLDGGFEVSGTHSITGWMNDHPSGTWDPEYSVP